jgi:hypothetical protein
VLVAIARKEGRMEGKGRKAKEEGKILPSPP